MRNKFFVALVFVAGVSPLFAAGPFRGRGGCSGGSCSRDGSAMAPVNFQPADRICGPEGCPVPAATFKWIPSKRVNGANRYELQRNGVMVGYYDVEGAYYQEWLGHGLWGPETKPPIALTADMQPAELVTQDIPGGVDREKIKSDGWERWDINGVRCPTFEALLQQIEDDSGKMWLVVTGDNREKFLADLRADPRNKDLLSRCRVWSVPANDWSILDRETKKPMFPIGNPGVFLGLPDGRKLFEGTGQIDVEALRKSDPLNKPAPVPNPVPNQPIPPPAPQPLEPASPLHKAAIPLCCVAGGVLIMAALRRK